MGTPPKPRRILVTGSRNFADQDLVELALRAADILVDSLDAPRILVHGAAGGLDHTAEHVASRLLGWTTEGHPARWGIHGKCWCKDHTKPCRFAGPRRNLEMIASGADLVLAFPQHKQPDPKGSRGTWQCATAAKDAGLPVLIVWNQMFFPFGSTGDVLLARQVPQAHTGRGAQGQVSILDAWLPF